MKKIGYVMLAAVALALSLCAGCIGEGEQEFRPTPGVINIQY